MHICNVRSQVFFPGVWVCLRDFILFFIFLAALSANLHCGKTLGLEKSFEHGKVFQEYGWETRTFEEGKKKAPLIQGGGLRQAHTIEKVENPSSRLLIYSSTMDPMGYKVIIFSSPRFEDVVEYVGHAFWFWCTVWDPNYLDGKRHTQPFLSPPKPAHACPICCRVE